MLDLANVCKLTDSSLGYLANGCQALEKLIFCRNSFRQVSIPMYSCLLEGYYLIQMFMLFRNCAMLPLDMVTWPVIYKNLIHDFVMFVMCEKLMVLVCYCVK